LKYIVSALYQFVLLDNPRALRQSLRLAMAKHNIKGTLLLAREGINGTVSGSKESMVRFLTFLRSECRFENLRSKDSYCDKIPFNRAKVKLKKEIVTMGVPDIDPQKLSGTYVKPRDWNALISDPDTVLIDTRNQYEVNIGTFKNAIDPNTQSFRQFPEYARNRLDAAKHKNVAMFCTGGIRCEKATAYLKGQGFENVYHLQGGILQYLQDVPESESLWQGDCFVFDRRVTVDHNLAQGQYDLCFACRNPISNKDKLTDAYVEGISCPHCIDKTTDQQKERFRERQKQLRLEKLRCKVPQ